MTFTVTLRAALVAVAMLACHTSVLAQEAGPSLGERVAAQDAAIAEKDRQIARLAEPAEGEGGWFDAVEIGGMVEVGADVVLLYEQADDDLAVDAATITAAPAEVPWQLTAGRHVLGSFETHPVSDPLTLELGETREIDVQLAAASGGFAGSVFAFDGAADRKDRDRSAGCGEEAGGGEADTVTLRLATEF